MKLYQIEKPDLKKYLRLPPDYKASDEPALRYAIAQKYKEYKSLAFGPDYLYWDKLKYKLPDVVKEDLWIAIKEYRKEASVEVPVKNEKGEFFRWVKLPHYEEFFHFIDLQFAGSFGSDVLGQAKLDKKTMNRFKTRGILEEAITSSQIEGANTTRRMAKELIKSGRKPINKSEQMILNNYQAMRSIEEEYKDKKLSKELLLEMHDTLTKNTLEQKDIGRFRNDSDNIVVMGNDGETIYFIPPKADFVEKEIERLIMFANDEDPGSFIHPVAKAVMIHFWIGYLHPFCDGNGRLARILFYWHLIKKDYWIFTYLSFSYLILRSRKQYENAYLYSEQDDNDLTYFINYNIQKINDSLGYFLKKSREKIKQSESMLNVKITYGLNARQLDLLEYFIEHPEEKTTPTIHKNTHMISKLTAINDLKLLSAHGFLLTEKQGKNKYYYPSPDLKNLLK